MFKKWKIRKVKLVDAKMFDKNPRSISEKALSGLTASMSRFGYVEPIVWNERTKHIIGGHQRYSVLVSKGVEEAMMVVVNMPPEEEMAANLTLNNPAIEGDWNEPVMDLLAQVDAGMPDLYKSLNMADLQRELEKGIAKQPANENEPDTTCPCCGHGFKIEAKDVSVVSAGK